jgi:nucleotide-binding universal stress UspA family protein
MSAVLVLWECTFRTTTQENAMTIVTGIDNSLQAKTAAIKAAHLAALQDETLHIVSSVSANKHFDIGLGSDHIEFDSIQLAKNVVDGLAAELRATEHVGVTTAVLRNDPATALCVEAERLDASMIVVGNKRVHGVGRVLGSVASTVTKSAPCDVLIVHTYS